MYKTTGDDEYEGQQPLDSLGESIIKQSREEVWIPSKCSRSLRSLRWRCLKGALKGVYEVVLCLGPVSEGTPGLPQQLAFRLWVYTTFLKALRFRMTRKDWWQKQGLKKSIKWQVVWFKRCPSPLLTQWVSPRGSPDTTTGTECGLLHTGLHAAWGLGFQDRKISHTVHLSTLVFIKLCLTLTISLLCSHT